MWSADPRTSRVSTEASVVLLGRVLACSVAAHPRRMPAREIEHSPDGLRRIQTAPATSANGKNAFALIRA
jgi:hypothetical protein